METWISLMDYAMKRGVSLSTLRRYIKSNKVRYRVENGRYLLLDDGIRGTPERASVNIGSQARTVFPKVSHDLEQTDENQQMHSKIGRLTQELKLAREEIAELKTLIAFYEQN